MDFVLLIRQLRFLNVAVNEVVSSDKAAQLKKDTMHSLIVIDEIESSLEQQSTNNLVIPFYANQIGVTDISQEPDTISLKIN